MMNIARVCNKNKGHKTVTSHSNNVEVEVKKELEDMFVNAKKDLIDIRQRSVFVEATSIHNHKVQDPLSHFIDDQRLPKLEIKEDVDELCIENTELPYDGEELYDIVAVQDTAVSTLSKPSTSKDFSTQDINGCKRQEKLVTDDKQRELLVHHCKMAGQTVNFQCLEMQSSKFVKGEGAPSFDTDKMAHSSRTETDDGSDVIDLYLKLLKDKFICKLCNKKYTDIERCKGHIRSHLGFKPFVCSHTNCTKSFSSKDSLRSHVYLIHIAHDRFKCKMCDRTFNKRSLFTEHCNKHNAIMPFDCAICGKAFPGKDSIFLHIVDVHNYGEQSHLCPKCGKVFSNRRNLRCHLRTHGEKRFKCEVCNSYFISRLKLSNHAASHSTERPFQCSLCSKSYRLQTTLHRHVMTTHEKKKNFKCSTCDKSFVSGSFLREHLLKHEGVRKYSCETCGKTFAQASHLGAHKFSHGEKKFECSVCGAKFNRHDNMKSHVKRHQSKK